MAVHNPDNSTDDAIVSGRYLGKLVRAGHLNLDVFPDLLISGYLHRRAGHVS